MDQIQSALPWVAVLLISGGQLALCFKLASGISTALRDISMLLGGQQPPKTVPAPVPPISVPLSPATIPPAGSLQPAVKTGQGPPVALPVTQAPPPKDNFDACMVFVWPEEGGFSNDPQDHGGPTNLGVTEPDLVRAGMPATIDDIKALTKPIAASRIYRPFYWNAMHCDELPRGVDLCVFDLGINAGIHEAAKLLQRDVGVTTDGVIGPLTIAAVKNKPAADIIRTFTEERLSFYQSLKQFDRFGRDWTKRTNDCHAAALKMAQGAAALAPVAKS
jgi:lysozyme family protein